MPRNFHAIKYIDFTENHIRYLVNQTSYNVELQGRNISMDRLYATGL